MEQKQQKKTTTHKADKNNICTYKKQKSRSTAAAP